MYRSKYSYALSLKPFALVPSAVCPYLFFRWRGWL